MSQKIDPEVAAETVRSALLHGSNCISHHLPVNWDQFIDQRSTEIRRQLPFFNFQASPVVVLFHIDLPVEERSYVAPDVRISSEKHDFESVIKLNIRTIRWFNPSAYVILITDETFLKDYKEKNLSVIRLSIKPHELMFERVCSMVAIARAVRTAAPLIFLDSDAFLVNSIQCLFNVKFDVAVTYRMSRSVMPVNEGVIVVKGLETDAVRAFFDRYLATYLALEASEQIQAIYPRLRRWRGGQLSLNVVWQSLSDERVEWRPQPKLIELPTTRFNLTVDAESQINYESIAQTLVIHLKGNRKEWINRLESELQRHCSLPAEF